MQNKDIFAILVNALTPPQHRQQDRCPWLLIVDALPSIRMSYEARESSLQLQQGSEPRCTSGKASMCDILLACRAQMALISSGRSPLR